MFDEVNNFADIFRAGLPYYFLFALPILILCSSQPVLATEFSVSRMSSWDINGVAYGCRASAMSLEAKSKYTWSTNRHCVITKLQDLSIDEFHQIRQKAGGLVILLPKDFNEISSEVKEYINLLEQAMLSKVTSVPVYFSQFNSELEAIISDVTNVKSGNSGDVDANGIFKHSSVLGELFATISANSYQITVSGASHAPNKNSKIPVIQGELVPNYSIKITDNGAADLTNNLPTIIITAHLQTFGIFNKYPLNSDVAILLSLAELFSKLQNIPSAVPKYRIIFLLSESGVFLNYQGAKKWLDENLSLQNVEFVLCLDTISKGLDYGNDSALYMHVSKPPKEGSSINTFFKYFKLVGNQHSEENITIEGVHKKINLAESQLAWEHERFSMKRFPAFTLSSVRSPKHPIRTSVFKDNEARIMNQTNNVANIIAESLARYIYNLEHDELIFIDSLTVNVKSFFNIRSHLYNNDLKDGFEKYLKNVKLVFDKPDVREPDFMLYDGADAKMNIYRVKPAVFDLLLTIVITAYLTLIYFVVMYFSHFYNLVCESSKVLTPPANGNYPERNKTKYN